MGGQLAQVVYLSQLLGSLQAFHGGVVGLGQPILSMLWTLQSYYHWDKFLMPM